MELNEVELNSFRNPCLRDKSFGNKMLFCNVIRDVNIASVE